MNMTDSRLYIAAADCRAEAPAPSSGAAGLGDEAGMARGIDRFRLFREARIALDRLHRPAFYRALYSSPSRHPYSTQGF
jgi:hypothetical protein